MIPAHPIFFNPFLLSQIKRETFFSTFSAITSAVAWAHKKHRLQSPTESATTKQLIRAGQRILGCATAKGKHPLEIEHLKAPQDKFAFASLDQLQIVTLATLGFAGFLRWDNLSQIRACGTNFLTSIYVNVTYAAFPNAPLFPACSHMILFWLCSLVLMQTIPRAPCACAKVVFSHLLSFQQESGRTLLFYNPVLV